MEERDESFLEWLNTFETAKLVPGGFKRLGQLADPILLCRIFLEM